jgi:pyruvyl transferase EpsO
MESTSAQLGLLLDTVRRLAGPGDRPYALLDYPDHSNPGDAAIWSGERSMLASLYGAPPVYAADLGSFREDVLRHRLRDGTIFLHGGGNFGDLWERFQRFRERVVQAFPGSRIVGLPQTVHFTRPESLDRARAAFDAHPDLTLLVRDARSLEIVRQEFACRSELCPDSAVALGRLPRPAAAERTVVWLVRTDQESRQTTARAEEEESTRETVDWTGDEPVRLLRRDRRLRRLRSRAPALERVLEAPSRALGDAAARWRLDRGLRILSTGQVVVTDRLHGHILASLLRIPHVLLDNAYGKNRRYYETWSAEDPVSRWADSFEEAAEAAAALVGSGAGADVARDTAP